MLEDVPKARQIAVQTVSGKRPRRADEGAVAWSSFCPDLWSLQKGLLPIPMLHSFGGRVFGSTVFNVKTFATQTKACCCIHRAQAPR